MRLTTELSDFSFSIPGLGDSLELTIALTSTDSFEPLALDNIRVTGIPIPEPASGVLAMSLGCGLALIRRRRRTS